MTPRIDRGVGRFRSCTVLTNTAEFACAELEKTPSRLWGAIELVIIMIWGHTHRDIRRDETTR